MYSAPSCGGFSILQWERENGCNWILDLLLLQMGKRKRLGLELERLQ